MSDASQVSEVVQVSEDLAEERLHCLIVEDESVIAMLLEEELLEAGLGVIGTVQPMRRRHSPAAIYLARRRRFRHNLRMARREN